MALGWEAWGWLLVGRGVAALVVAGLVGAAFGKEGTVAEPPRLGTTDPAADGSAVPDGPGTGAVVRLSTTGAVGSAGEGSAEAEASAGVGLVTAWDESAASGPGAVDCLAPG
ncbi:MAG: hypothetical protein Q4G45_10360 [Actinomycetia bacterium]|nr:hypothetical protein [Actinomycetes bacterium]